MEQSQNQRKWLTTRSSIGIGVGNFSLYRSLISFTTNTISKTISDVTRSAMFVFVIWLKTLSRVCRIRKKRGASETVMPWHSNTSRRTCIWTALRIVLFGIYSLWHDVDCKPPSMCVHLPNDGTMCKRPFPLTCHPLLQICPWRRVETTGISIAHIGIAGHTPFSTPSFLSFFSLLSHPTALTQSYTN